MTRVALVTGGSKNLGKHMAQGFIAAGAERVYINSRKADACEKTAAELGPKCIPLAMDVSSVENCKALAAALAEREPKLDILVNNAGAAWGEAFETFPEVGWDKVMDLNVKGPFFLTQALLPLIADGGRILNISSGLARFAAPGSSASETGRRWWPSAKARARRLARRSSSLQLRWSSPWMMAVVSWPLRSACQRGTSAMGISMSPPGYGSVLLPRS